MDRKKYIIDGIYCGCHKKEIDYLILDGASTLLSSKPDAVKVRKWFKNKYKLKTGIDDDCSWLLGINGILSIFSNRYPELKIDKYDEIDKEEREAKIKKVSNALLVTLEELDNGVLFDKETRIYKLLDSKEFFSKASPYMFSLLDFSKSTGKKSIYKETLQHILLNNYARKLVFLEKNIKKRRFKKVRRDNRIVSAYARMIADYLYFEYGVYSEVSGVIARCLRLAFPLKDNIKKSAVEIWIKDKKNELRQESIKKIKNKHA